MSKNPKASGGKLRQEIAKLGAQLEIAERRCAAMQEVARSLTAVADIDELLRLVAERVTTLMDADRSTIFLLDKERRQLWSKVAQGEGMQEIRLPVEQGLAGWVAREGRTLNLRDAYADERFHPEIDRHSGYRTRSVLSVPLRGKSGEVLGVVQTLNKRQGYFSVEDESLLEAICSQVAVAIENTQLVLGLLARNIELVEAQEQLARRVRELDTLVNLEHVAAAAVHIDEMLERLLRQTVELLGCEAGSIVLLDEQGQELVFAGAVGGRAEAVKRLRLQRGSGVAGWVAENGRSAVVTDPSADPRHLAELEDELHFPVRSILAVPLGAGGEVIGALELLNKMRGCFEEEDEKLATLIAGQAHSAIMTWRQREEREKENRLSSIGQMLSGVIHDLRTPMTIISGYVQLMTMEDNQQKRRQQSEVILRQFDFINNMARELLAFARGDSQLLLHKVYTNQFFEQMRELLERELAPAGIELELQDNYQGPLRVDENKLRRAVFNLARNARQAMPSGGHFQVRLDDAGERVRFTFTDDGPGIPESIRHRLFNSFVSAGKQEGTGLGLAIVRKIAEEHGGTITADSRPGQGATFVLELPKRMEDAR